MKNSIHTVSIILFLLTVTVPNRLSAQAVSINPTGAVPNMSAMLDLSSTDKGILIPRATDAQRQALKDPVAGLIIYNTTSNQFNYYNGSNWISVPNNNVSSNSGSGTSPGQSISINTSGNNAAASAILDVSSSEKGVLIPRTTHASVTPVEGLIIYNNSTNTIDYYNGTFWRSLCANTIDNITGTGASTQGVAINNTGTSPDASALLDISSTSKGLLIPRMTSTERDVLKTPATGLIIYNTTTDHIESWDGSSWQEMVNDGGLGNNANGVITGATLDNVNQKLGTGCYSFDGSDDDVDVGNDPGLDGSSDLTINLWVNKSSTANQMIIGKGSANAYELLSSNSDNTIIWRIHDGATKDVTSTSTLSAGTWYMITTIYDNSASETRLYINGTLEATLPGIGTLSTTSNPLFLGRNNAGNYYSGKLDDMGLWTRVLTTSEINDLYNSGTGALVSTLSNQNNLEAYYDFDSQTSTSTPWDVNSVTYNSNSFDVSGQSNNVIATYFRSDGQKFYVTGENSDVFEYDIPSASAWDISAASYSNNSWTHGQANPKGLFFNPDGTQMYTAVFNTQTVYQYQLSTAWDLSSTITANGNTGGVSTAQDLFFDNGGTRMFVTDNSGVIRKWNLTTAWDIDGGKTADGSYNHTAQVAVATAMHFSPDGTTMWLAGFIGGQVFEYSLSTPWQISSGVTFVKQFDGSSEDGDTQGMFWSQDGTKFYRLGQSDRVFEYDTDRGLKNKAGCP